MIINPKNPELPINYYCEKCNFTTCNKKDYSRHLHTKKHLINDNQSLSIQKTPKLQQQYICENCNKEYKENSGLWRHKKNCSIKNLDNIKEISDKELIMMLIKDNA